MPAHDPAKFSSASTDAKSGGEPPPRMGEGTGPEDSRTPQSEGDRFFDLSLDMLCIAKPDGYFKRLNPAFARTLGWSEEEMLARPFLEFVHPADRPATVHEVERLAAGHPVTQFENRYQCKDGSWRLLAWKSVPQSDGTIYAVARDVTEQRQDELRLRSLYEEMERLVEERTVEMREALTTLDVMEDAAFSIDPETLRYTFANQGAVRQLGYTREELLAMTVMDIKPEFQEARYREIVSAMLRGEFPSYRFVTLHRHKDGREIPVEINLQYVNPDGGTPRFVSIVRDITKRQQIERLAHRSQRLEAIGTLTSGVAHDLNNALAPIMMGVEMLGMEHPGASGIVNMIRSSARRGADIVRQLLTFAKGAEGERASVQTSHLITEMQSIMAGTFPKNIRLATKCDRNLPTVLGDATQLHQILMNFCVNAREAMPRGGTLTLEARRVQMDGISAASIPDASPGDYVVLSASDTGTGIAPEMIDRIFEPFFTTRTPDKGTGLGLSTVMGIVKGHGGFLNVQSEPGRGSKFSAYLPVNHGVEDPPAPVTRPDEQFGGQGELILFVDDEAVLRTVAGEVLRRMNFKAVTATDGVDALIKAAEHRTELTAIITDMHMAQLDGIGFVRALRRMLPDIPVLFVSGRLDDAEKEEIQSLGVSAHLLKPFSEAQLAAAMQSLLGSGFVIT